MMTCHFYRQKYQRVNSISKSIYNILIYDLVSDPSIPSSFLLLPLFFSTNNTPPPLKKNHKSTFHYKYSHLNTQFMSISVLIQILLRISTLILLYICVVYVFYLSAYLFYSFSHRNLLYECMICTC